MGRIRDLAAALIVAGSLGAATTAQAACKFQRLAEVPIIMEGTRPTIVAQVNGKDARFLVDTGAFFGGVTLEAGERLGMKHSTAPYGMTVTGAGGQTRDARAMRADTLSFAGLGFRNVDFLVIGRIGGDMVGNIGENLMGPLDVEYDFANGVMRYFKAEGCGAKDNLAYWSKGLALSRVDILDPTRITLKVVTNAKVDGHTVRVLWDSGASLSVLNESAAARAGVTVKSEGSVDAGLSYGIFGRGNDQFMAPFASFAVGGEEIKNTRLRVTKLGISDEAEMLLGADFFLSHRILISNSQKQVYFTYNGGAVFRMDQPPTKTQLANAGGSSPAPGAAAAEPGMAPKTTAEFVRRAAASAARRDFVQAIADYGQAVALEPDNAALYRARAMARLQAGQPMLAMSDLNEALKRAPNDPEALLRRGEIYLANHNLAGARADFDAATRVAPERADVASEAAAVYSAAGEYDLAINQMDAWVAAHPKNENLGSVLGARCYARAAAGKELDKALADCDLAVRKDPNSQTMQTRALTLLRLGRLDEAIAQYSSALKVQPRDAMSLYGRGLAELRKGQDVAGAGDIAAATGIAPGIAAQFKRMGLEPPKS